PLAGLKLLSTLSSRTNPAQARSIASAATSRDSWYANRSTIVPIAYRWTCTSCGPDDGPPRSGAAIRSRTAQTAYRTPSAQRIDQPPVRGLVDRRGRDDRRRLQRAAEAQRPQLPARGAVERGRRAVEPLHADVPVAGERRRGDRAHVGSAPDPRAVGQTQRMEEAVAAGDEHRVASDRRRRDDAVARVELPAQRAGPGVEGPQRAVLRAGQHQPAGDRRRAGDRIAGLVLPHVLARRGAQGEH